MALFFLSKENMYIKKRGDTKNSVLKVYKKYTKEAKRLKPKGKGYKQKTTHALYLEPIQSMKLKSEKGLKSTNTLD